MLNASLRYQNLPAKISKEATVRRKKLFQILSMPPSKVTNNVLNKLNLVKFSDVIKMCKVLLCRQGDRAQLTCLLFQTILCTPLNATRTCVQTESQDLQTWTTVSTSLGLVSTVWCKNKKATALRFSFASLFYFYLWLIRCITDPTAFFVCSPLHHLY